MATLCSRAVLLLACAVLCTGAKQAPNIVWFLTDDQDQVLGASFPEINGVGPMPKTKALMADMGTMANNFYIHTPICCPSRSELISGRYFHNIKQTHGGCMHVNEDIVNNNTFAKYLKQEAGYTVGMFGKYLNNVPNYVPVGFDAWLANGGGTYISPEFATWNIDGLPNGSWTGSPENYTTAVVGNLSIHWIKKVVKENPNRPFFAYVAPKAAHEPFNPAPWYVDHWDPAWPAHEPRPVNWNCSFESRKNHPPAVATEALITEAAATVITGVFKDRWRTLMSVDDVIADVIKTCQDLGVDKNTYYFYSSDHGFQLGEFNIPMDKRHVYEWDIKIHLLARGPGIKPGSTWNEPATQVDMAPTFLGLAGLQKPAQMDGKSIVPLLISDATELSEPSRKHLESLGSVDQYKANWRTSVFVEYYYVEWNVKCVEDCKPGNYPQKDSYCTDLDNNTACWCQGTPNSKNDCHATESPSNSFIGIRTMKGSEFGNMLYAEYTNQSQNEVMVNFTEIAYYELFDLDNDPWEMNNLHGKQDSAKLKKALHQYFNCAGDACP